MGPCLLADIPAAAFQATLQSLGPSDVANLRHVSRNVSCRTTQHAPYVILRITGSTSREDLRQWCQVTRRLQHVTHIKVLLSGSITAEVFDLAMKLLSQRHRVEQIDLLAVVAGSSSDSNSSSNTNWEPDPLVCLASIPSLYPIHHLAKQLKALSIRQVAIDDLGNDLARLAAASPPTAAAAQAPPGAGIQVTAAGVFPQLRSLAIQASWTPTTRPVKLLILLSGMPLLSVLVPGVRQLALHIPPLALETGAASAAAAALSMQQQVAVISAAADAVIQLQGLESLALTGLPDIWARADAAVEEPRALLAPAAVPAAALRTLDSFGCWLLQQHRGMRELKVACLSGWSMTWQQPLGSSSGTAVGSTAAAGLTTIRSITARTRLSAVYSAGPSQRTRSPGDAGSSSSSSSSSRSSRDMSSLSELLAQRLGHYSHRSVSDLMPHITTCQLSITHLRQAGDLADLAGQLSRMTSLKHLKISLLCTSSQHGTVNCAAAVAAAAAVKGLQSLTLLVGMGAVHVTPDLLLPFTAAAGGLGSSLQKLKLIGTFKHVPAAAARAAKNSAAAAQTSAAAAAAAASGWRVLRQLTSLQELYIHQLGADVLELPADCLPPSVIKFHSRQVVMIHLSDETSAAAAAAAASSQQQDTTGSSNCDKDCSIQSGCNYIKRALRKLVQSSGREHQLQVLTAGAASSSVGGSESSIGSWLRPEQELQLA